MNVVICYNTADKPRAIEMLEQCKKWRALERHALYLMPSFDCVPIPEIIPFIGLTDYLQVSSDWRQADGVRHANANGPNSAFVQVARYFCENKLGPFFWCEPDCVPLHSYSFDKLEEAYLACGKPFMGGYAPAPVPHLNGNSIYPERAAFIQSLVLPMRSDDGTRDIAFDVAAAREILPQAHCTELIQHLWRGPSFTSQEDFDTRIRKDALFFHQCRDGSIYKYLNGGDAPCPIILTTPKEKEQGSNGAEQVQPPTAPTLSPFAVLSKQDGVFRPSEDEQYAREYTAAGKTSFAPIPEPTLLERRRTHAANMRAALAAKRATGWRPTKKRKRKRAKSKA